MKFFVHLALDIFGAEVAGKAHAELAAVASPGQERHIFVWCGAGEVPAETDYWSERFPPWDSVVEWPTGLIPENSTWNLDRGTTALAIAGWQGLHDKVRSLLDQRPKQLLGAHAPFQTNVILGGSLALPTTGAILLGLLAMFARGRQHGLILGVPVHVVLGIGLAEVQSSSEEEEKTHALVARNLLDLSEFLQSTPAHQAAAPVYLIGESHLPDGAPGRAEQVATAAFTVLGVCRTITAPLNFPPDAVDPFAFEVDAAQQVHWANQRYDPARPFAVTGGYGVSCPVEPLARLLSARVAMVCFETLAKQEGCSTLDDAGKLQLPPSLGEFLSDVEGRAVAKLWNRVAEKTKIRWPSQKVGFQPQWYDLDRLKLLFGRLFEQRDWAHVLNWYGEDRMRALPLDHWPGAIDEMTAIIDQCVLARRQQQLAIIKQRVLVALLETVEGGVAEVFGKTFQEPVDDTPHITAQALLGKIRNHLEENRSRLEEVEARERPRLPDPTDLQTRAREARQVFERELAAVPSPAAVFVRTIPLFAVCLGLILALPFNLGLINPPLLRLVAGVLLGTSAVGYLYWRFVKVVTARIYKKFRVWMEDYKAILEFNDHLARNKAYSDLLASMIGCIEWLFNGKEPSPPIPKPMNPRFKHEKVGNTADPDLLKPQTVLSSFQEYLQDAARSYFAVQTRFLEDFQMSRRETILPEISVSTPQGIEGELDRIGFPGGQFSLNSIRLFYVGLAGGGRNDWLVPFSAGPDIMRDYLWHASFKLPSPKGLLDEDTRKRSSGFLFFDTLCQAMRARFSEAFRLSGRLDEYLQGCPHGMIMSTHLGKRYTSLAVPSVSTTSSRASIVVLGAYRQDPLAHGLNRSNEAGADIISLHLQVCNFLSASDIIYFPNEASPSQAIGLAWRRHLKDPWMDAIFKPVKLPEEMA